MLGEDKAENGRHGRHSAMARRRVARHRCRDGERRERRTAGHASHVGEARLASFDETRGAGVGLAGGTVHGQPGGRAGARMPSRRETEREEREGDGGEGSSVNKTKFKTPVCKLKFLFLFQGSNEKLFNTKLA